MSPRHNLTGDASGDETNDGTKFSIRTHSRGEDVNMKARLTATWCVCAASWSTACVSTTSAYNYQIEQKALVPTNAPPRAAGPLANAGDAYLEGGVQFGVVEQVGEQGARLIGHDVPLAQAHARAAYSPIERIEFGVSARYANSYAAVSATRRPREMEREDAHTGGLGFQLRLVPVGDARLGLVLSTETGLDVIPVRRDVYTSRTDTIERPGSDWATQYPDRLESKDDVNVLMTMGFGLSLQGSPLPGVSGELGVRMSTQPQYFGAKNVAEVCEEYSLSWTCEGGNLSTVPHASSEVQGTVFGVAMFEVVERTWSVGGKAWWTPWGPQSLARASPGGGEFMVRRHFQ